MDALLVAHKPEPGLSSLLGWPWEPWAGREGSWEVKPSPNAKDARGPNIHFQEEFALPETQVPKTPKLS